jgi:competence protein ComEA
MRSRSSTHDQVAEVARRRLELLSAELAGMRTDQDTGTGVADVLGAGGPPERSGGGPSPSSEQPPAPVRGRHAQRSVGPGASLTGWLHDRLPATLQGRLRLDPSHLLVLVLLVAGALTATGWWVVRADDRGTVVAPVSAADGPLVSPAPAPSTTTGPSPPPAGPSVAASAAPSGTIVVDVAGKVRRPGIATLPLGSRVVDAISAAGGPRRGAAVGSLNLARVLTDGEQVVVGIPAPGGVAASAVTTPDASAGSAIPMVNLNSANQADLEELPGIGPVTAQAILTYRSENGPFTAVDQLVDVSGIGDATLAKIAPFVTL